MESNSKPIEPHFYLIPLPIAENSIHTGLIADYQNIVKNIKHFVTENARTLRRYLSSLKLGIDIASLEIVEINKEQGTQAAEDFLRKWTGKVAIGISSEAGMPGIADPGAFAVAWAHKHQCKIHALTGASSIFLALASSGLNGQAFTFHGYPPIKDQELATFLSKIIQQSVKTGYTQIFIEAPYRSDRLLKAFVNSGYSQLLLCVASDIQGNHEFIRTQTIAQWSASIPQIGKNPTVFLVGNQWAV